MNDEIKKLEKDSKVLNDRLEEYKKIKYQMMDYDFSKIKNMKNMKNINKNNKNNINDEIETIKNRKY